MKLKLGIPKEVRDQVRARDQFTCRMCGATQGEPHQEPPFGNTRVYACRIDPDLVHGRNDLTNLRTLCTICHAGLSSICVSRPTFIELKSQMMRAAYKDQVKLLQALISKFPNETHSLIQRG